MMFQEINKNIHYLNDHQHHSKYYFLITNGFDFLALPLQEEHSKFFGYFLGLQQFTKSNPHFNDFHVLSFEIPFRVEKVFENINYIYLIGKDKFIYFELSDSLKVKHNLGHLIVYINLMPRYYFEGFNKTFSYNGTFNFQFRNNSNYVNSKLKIPIKKINGWKKIVFDYDIKRNSSPKEYWMIESIITEKEFEIELNELEIKIDDFYFVLKKEFLIKKIKQINDFLKITQEKDDLIKYALNKFYRYQKIDNTLLLPIAGYWWFDEFWLRDALWVLDAFPNTIKENIINASYSLIHQFNAPVSNIKGGFAIDSLLLLILNLLENSKTNEAMELLQYLTPFLKNDIIICPEKSTWTDSISREYAIEVNALWDLINKKLGNSKNLYYSIVKNFKKFDYNVILAYFINDSFEEMFIKELNTLLKNYSIQNERFFAITTKDTRSNDYVPIHTGEEPRSYHKGDAWLWITNIFAINLINLIKNNKIEYHYMNIIKKIINLNMYYLTHSMLFSLPELTDSTFEQKGSPMQLWSVGTFYLLRKKLNSDK